MKSTTRKGFRLGLVAGLAVTGIVGATLLTASGTEAAPVSYGTLTLTLTDRAGSLTLVRGTETFTQPLGVNTPCSTLAAGAIVGPGVLPSNSSLLKFSAAVSGGSVPNVQLPSNGIGITDGANCGTPSGLVGPGETLTLALGSFLPDNVTISTGTLQIGKSRGSDGDLRVAYDNGSFPTTANTVQIGVQSVQVAKAGGFKSISIRSTTTDSSRGLSLRSSTVFNLMAPAPATVPGAPIGVTAASGNAQADVSWTAPLDNGGSGITGYVLQYSGNGGSTWTPQPPTAATSGGPVTGLSNGTEYIFRVAAVNAVGTSTFTQSNAVTPATVPGAPAGVTAVRGNTQADVSWTAPLDNGGSGITGYVLQYSGNGGSTWTPQPPTAATSGGPVTGLSNGTEYIFRVAAVNAVGTSTFTQSNAVTPWTKLVNCGDTVSDNGGLGEIAKTAVFLRGENGAKPTAPAACEDVGVVVEIIGNDWVYWDNSSIGVNGNAQAVRGTVTIDWSPIPVAKADLPTQIDYDGPGGPATFVDRPWCLSYSKSTIFDTVSNKTKITFTATLPLYSGPGANTNGTVTIADDTAPWCLVSSSQPLDGSGNVNRTEVFFGAGDPLTRTIR